MVLWAVYVAVWGDCMVLWAVWNIYGQSYGFSVKNSLMLKEIGGVHYLDQHVHNMTWGTQTTQYNWSNTLPIILLLDQPLSGH